MRGLGSIPVARRATSRHRRRPVQVTKRFELNLPRATKRLLSAVLLIAYMLLQFFTPHTWWSSW